MIAAPRALGRILTPAQAGLYATAEGALALAQAQVATMLSDAAQAIEGERQAVLARAEAAGRLQAAALLADTAAAARAQLAALAPDVTQAVGLAVAKVVGDLPLSQAVAQAARHALQELATRNGVAVHVHPDQAAGVRTILAELGDGVRVVGDETLPADACTIETQAGIVRAGLSEQVAILQSALAAC